MGTNLKAPLFLSQAAAPHLRAIEGSDRQHDRHSRAASLATPSGVQHGKGRPRHADAIARARARPDVRVNGISPGPILWPEGGIDESLKDEIVAKTLLKRSGSPDDIVRTALFFAMDAPYVTGQILAVDGGRSVGW